jgi:hypothetical protein
MLSTLGPGSTEPGITYDFEYDQNEPTILNIAWVSCYHISRASWDVLMTSRPADWGVFDAPFGINGVSIVAFDPDDELPGDVLDLCSHIVERGHDHLLIDASGPTVRGLPIYRDWNLADEG